MLRYYSTEVIGCLVLPHKVAFVSTIKRIISKKQQYILERDEGWYSIEEMRNELSWSENPSCNVCVLFRGRLYPADAHDARFWWASAAPFSAPYASPTKLNFVGLDLYVQISVGVQCVQTGA